MIDHNSLWMVISLTIIVLVALAATINVVRASRRSQDPIQSQPMMHDHDARDVWVIANPIKPSNFERFQQQINAEVKRVTGRPARWLETTVEEPGTSQTIKVLRHHPALVIAAGGDGTVRAVAAGMAYSRVPMGLIPMGTGNLMARNLDIPLDPSEAIKVALTPVSRRVDLGWLRVERVGEPSGMVPEGHHLVKARAFTVRSLPPGAFEPLPTEYSYLVIAGVGFDGETMAQTRPQLKKAVGWSAYVFTALKSLRIERMKATITLYNDEEGGRALPQKSLPIPHAVRKAVRASHTIGAPDGVSPVLHREDTWDMTALRARTILFANCGGLPFAQLAPEALIDDGHLDVIAIDTQGGLLGWAYLSVKVFGNALGVWPINVKNDLASIQFRQTTKARVDISKSYPVQIDGDPIGTARTVIARVDPNALLVRVPQGSPAAIPEWDRRM